MKKNIVIIIVAVLILATAGVIAFTVNTKNKKDSYPKIVYINNVSYYGTDEKCEMVPRRMPDGTITTFTPAEIMPDMFESANFGSEFGSMEYMILEDGRLIVHMGEDWYYFDEQ